MNHQCIHARIAKILIPSAGSAGIIPRARGCDVTPIFETKLSHLHVYADWDGDSPEFRLICRTEKRGGLPYLLCDCQHRCVHINALLQWKPGLSRSTSKSCKSSAVQALQQWDTISTQPILVPFDAEAQQSFIQAVPNKLYSKYDKTVRCRHGSRYHSGHPVKNNWQVSNKDATLMRRFITYSVTVYYRPSTCGLGCGPQYYDGAEDGILNVKPSFLACWSDIWFILSLMQHNTMTLHGFWKASNLYGNEILNGHTVPIEFLRHAYMGFMRLMKTRSGINLFKCRQCEVSSKMVITCDGLQLGHST